MQWETISASESETIDSGQKLAGFLNKGDIVALSGQVGSGKTIFVKGVCKAFAISPAVVHSPTFLIMNLYEGKFRDEQLAVRHFDFYRLEREEDLRELGVDEWLDDRESIKLIEWSEHIHSHLVGRHWFVRLEVLEDVIRRIEIEFKD
ncbi:MAG: tRNA (adenosine(37)-N6)-threonylcarbamoyltransferase complex ATPase subunit type 1 TsaE [Bacteroidetes bacterium]|nr:tRNA (adenosine(37)-N6)-threonylcarbamoyltransferase complex ATPase subunit type 1 TsaE [Bacteroidota bacterium]